MKSLVVLLLAVIPQMGFASERLEVLKYCLSLSNDYADAGLLFVDTSTPGNRQRASGLLEIGSRIYRNRQILDIVAGKDAVKALRDTDLVLQSVLGTERLGTLKEDVISCRTKDRNYDCEPYFAVLVGSAKVVNSACKTDYNNWKPE